MGCQYCWPHGLLVPYSKNTVHDFFHDVTQGIMEQGHAVLPLLEADGQVEVAGVQDDPGIYATSRDLQVHLQTASDAKAGVDDSTREKARKRADADGWTT